MTRFLFFLTGSLLLAASFLAAVAAVTVTAPIGAAQLGVSYSSTLTASGGFGAPYTFAGTSGGLPPGLTLNGNTGAITGLPSQIGTFTFTITATDSPNLITNIGTASCRGRV